MPLDETQRHALSDLGSALVERAALAPFHFTASEIPHAWLRAFPADTLGTVDTLVDDQQETRPEDNEMRAVQFSSPHFGDRVVVLAPVRDPLLGSGLGREALAAVAHLRAHLPMSMHCDVYLMLVGCPTEHSDTLETAFRVVERNERICRTFAWLPTRDAVGWPQQLEHLFARTFLANPFHASAPAQQNLDPLRAALNTLASAPTPLSEDQLRSWEMILTSGDPGLRMAEALLAALE